jgi:hypothetical protein
VRENIERRNVSFSALRMLLPLWEGAGRTLYNLADTGDVDFYKSEWLYGSPEFTNVTNTTGFYGRYTGHVVPYDSPLSIHASLNCIDFSPGTYNGRIISIRGLSGGWLTNIADTGVVSLLREDTTSSFLRIVSTAESLSLRKTQAVCIRHDGSLLKSGGNAYVDGISRFDDTASTNGTTALKASTTADTCIFGDPASTFGTNPLRGQLFALTVFSADIGDDFAQELSATPYALLMPVLRPVYFDLATGNTNSSADPGNIAISGSSATGVKTSVSSANSGTVSIAGSVASGIRSLVSIATAASIAIAGFPAEGVYTPTGSTVSSAGSGIVAISGAPATGVQTHITSADPGTIVITGSDANAATGYASIAGPGTVAITGADATALRTHVSTASPSSIAIAGSPAYATKSGGSSTSSGISLIFGKVILHL